MATIAIIVAFSHIAADLDYELVREGNASLGLIRCQSCAPVKGKILIFGFQMWSNSQSGRVLQPRRFTCMLFACFESNDAKGQVSDEC